MPTRDRTRSRRRGSSTRPVGVTGLVLTKLDGTAKGGIVLAIAQTLKLPIRYIGVGEAPEDFGEFDAEAFAAALIEGPQAGAVACGGRRMIVFDRVSKRYANGREALTNVSFSIHNGEMVFLTGRSGAGKSTVLKLIALLERPTRGAVLVQGRNTQSAQGAAHRRLPPRHRRRLPGPQAARRPAGVRQRRPAARGRRHAAQGDRQARARRARSGGAAWQGARAAPGTVGRGAAARRHRARRGEQAPAADRR